jgi:hypothetical protein
LAPDQEQQARAVFAYLAPFLGMTFEQFEITFLRDADPQSELDIWSKIVAAHREFVALHPFAADDGGRDIFKCLLAISMMATRPDDVSKPLWSAVNEFVGN